MKNGTLLTLAALALLAESPAATLTWDANPATPGAQDGSGSWGPIGTNWWDGAANTNWQSATPDSAVIGNGGTSGTIGITGVVRAAALTFAAGGASNYLINGETLTLVADALVDVQKSATIAAPLAGTNVIKLGAQSLILSNASSLAGQLLVNSGELVLARSGALGALTSVVLNLSVGGGGSGTTLTLKDGVTVGAGVTLEMNSDNGANRRSALNNLSGTNEWAGRILVKGNGLDQPQTAAGQLTLSGDITNESFTGTLFLRGGGGAGFVNGHVDLGDGVLSKTDAGTWTVGAPGKTYRWKSTTVAVGTLRMGAANVLPATAVLTMGQGDGNSPTLDLAGYSQTVSGLVFSSSGGTKLITSAPAATFTVDTAGNYNYGGAIGGAISLVKAGPGLLELRANNTFTGVTRVAAGILKLAAVGSLYNNGAANGTLRVEPGATLFIGRSDVFGNHTSSPAPTVVVPTNAVVENTNVFNTLRALSLEGGELRANGGFSASYPAYQLKGPISVSAEVPSRLSAPGTYNANVGMQLGNNTAGGQTLITVADGASPTDLSVEAPLVDGRNAADNAFVPSGFIKAGAGTMLLATNNPFSGTATVQAGALVLGTAGALSNAMVDVGAAGLFDVTAVSDFTASARNTLQGSGLVTGTVQAVDGARIRPGGPDAAGTLTFANDLSLAGPGVTNQFNLGGSLAVGGGTNDLLVVAGNFEAQSSAVQVIPLAPLTSGTYRLINYAASTGTVSFGALLGNTGRDSWTLDTATPGQVNLLVAAGTNQSLVWAPTSSGAWDLGTSTNWFNSGASTPDAFHDLDTVLFDDSGAATNVVTLTTAVTPYAVTVNSDSNYTFAGSGAIVDGHGRQPVLTKDGAGALTIANTNTFGGGLVVSGGTVRLASTVPFGGGGVTLAAGGTLEDALGLTLTNALAGDGGVVMSGAGTQMLVAASGFTGPLLISNGTVAVTGGARLAFGVHAAPVEIGGTLLFNNATQTLAGSLAGTGTLFQTGTASVLRLSGTNTFSGRTFIQAGVTWLACSNGASVAGPFVVDNNFSPDVFMAASGQFAPGVVLTITNNAGDHLRFELLGTTQTLAGIHTTYAAQRGIIQNRDIGPAGVYTNAQLVLDGGGSYFYSGYIRDSQLANSNRLGFSKVGTGTQTLWGTVIDYTGPTIIGAGALVLTNVDDLWSQSVTISNGAALVVDTSARAFQYRGKATISGAGSVIALGGTFPSLWGNNNYGVTMAMETGSRIDVRAGLMRNEYGAFNNWTNNRASLSVSNGAIFNIWDANTYVDVLTGAGIVDARFDAYTLTIGAGDGSGQFDGVIRNTTGTLTLVKAGLGTQTLAGMNTYTGATTIAAGTLALAAGGAITGTPRIIVATAAVFDVTVPGTYSLADFQALEGAGTVAGTLRAGTGSRIIPGGAGAKATLSFASDLNLSAGTTNFFDLSPTDTTVGGGINDLIAVAGLLEPSNAVIAVSSPGALTNGAYRLFNYTGVKSSSFHPVPAGPMTRQTLTIDETTPGQVNLVVTGAPYSLTWNSQTSPNWDMNTGTNWFHAAGGTNTVYLDLDTVRFDDSGAATNNVLLVGALKPGGVTVDSASNYTFAGAGRITGSAGLFKDGPGVLTLAVTGSDYAAGTYISGGVIRVGAVNILPTNTLTTIAAGGTLNFDLGNATYTFPNSVAGTGRVLVTFTGATANNAYLTGAFTGFVGTVELTANGIVGSKLNNAGLNIAPGALIRVNTGAQFYVSGPALPNPIQLAGSGNSENRGGLRLGPSLLSGSIMLTASATIGPDGGTNIGPIAAGIAGNSSLTLGSGAAGGTALFLGPISNGVGTLELIVSNGTSTVLGTNTYTGGTSCRGGTLVVAELSDTGPSGIGTTGVLSFAGGTLRYIGAGPAATYRSVSNIGAGRAIFDVTNAAATLLLGGVIEGAGGLTKLGKGTLVISNHAVTALQANPGLEVRGGLLLLADSQINSQLPANNNDYIGRNAGDDATLTLAGSASYNRSNNVLYVGDQGGSKGAFNIQDNASFWGNYRVQLGQNIGATGTVNVAGGSFTLGNDLLVANSGVGTFHHTGGSYSNFGGYTYVGVNSNTLGRFFQSAGPAYVYNNLIIGHQGGANGAFYHTGGDLFVRGEFNVGHNAPGVYGFYLLTGGTVVNSNWHQAARNGLGLSYLLGGTFDHVAPAQGFVTGNGGGTGVFYIAGAQVNLAGRLGVGWWANARAEVTIAGTSTVAVGQAGVLFNQGTTATTFSVLNLKGGLLITSNMYKQVTGGYSVVNFDGGTLRARGSQTLLGPGAGGVGALDAAYVRAGGATIDTSNLTVTVTQPLRAPEGNGVTALPAVGAPASYLGAPYVSITGGGGTGATAVALIDHLSGTVTGLVLTSPGVGYTSGPNVTLVDGGTTNVDLGSATIGTNLSGGLVKLGSGELLLNGASTYTGDTVIAAGSLFGTGSVGSAVTVPAGGTLGPAVPPTLTGTFTVASSVTLSNGATLSVFLRGTNPTVRVGGDLVVAPTADLQFVFSGTLATGTYTLVDYGGALIGDVTNFNAATLPSGSYLTNNLAGTSLDLVVTNAGSLRWDGAVDALWQVGGPANWLPVAGGGPAAFSTLDTVLFDDGATANFTVDVAEIVLPASVTFGLTNRDYTLTGSGGIAGGRMVTKGGPGQLTLATPSVLGPTGQTVTLVGGALRFATDVSVEPYALTVRTNSALMADRATPGSGFVHALSSLLIPTNSVLTITNGPNVWSGTPGVTVTGRADFTGGGATLDIAPSNTLTLLGASGSAPNSNGSLTKNGAGTLIISGGNSYWDMVQYYFNEGTVIVRNGSAINDTATPVALGTNATLRIGLDGHLNNRGAITVNGDAAMILDRATPGNAFARTNASLTFAGGRLTVDGGANATGGTAALRFNTVTLSNSAEVLVRKTIPGVDTLVTLAAVAGPTFNLILDGEGSVLLLGASGLGTGRVLKTGSGLLTLRDAALSAGGVLVTNGLAVLEGTVTGAVEVAGAGTLMGTGTLSGTITSAGTVSPGLSVGKLATADFWQNPGGRLVIEIAGSGAGQCDLLDASGLVSLDGELVVSNAGYTAAFGDVITILTGDAGVLNTFATTNLPPLGGGLGWQVNYHFDRVELEIVTNAVPSPYDTWTASYSLSGTNALGTADPDGDGYANLLEYSQGSDPAISNADARVRGYYTNALLHLRFNNVTNATDITYVIEAAGGATNGADWSGILSNVSQTGWTGPAPFSAGATGPVYRVDVGDITTATQRVMRLRITRP